MRGRPLSEVKTAHSYAIDPPSMFVHFPSFPPQLPYMQRRRRIRSSRTRKLDGGTADTEGVSLGVENPLVVVVGRDLPGRVLGLDQEAVLEDLGEPEALLEVGLLAAAHRVDIRDAAEADAGAGRLVDSQERVPRPVLVLGVARRPVCVVEALDHLGPQHVAARRDPEPGFRVEVCPLIWRRLVVARVGSKLAVLPPEHFGSDLGLSV